MAGIPKLGKEMTRPSCTGPFEMRDPSHQPMASAGLIWVAGSRTLVGLSEILARHSDLSRRDEDTGGDTVSAIFTVLVLITLTSRL